MGRNPPKLPVNVTHGITVFSVSPTCTQGFSLHHHQPCGHRAQLDHSIVYTTCVPLPASMLCAPSRSASVQHIYTLKHVHTYWIHSPGCTHVSMPLCMNRHVIYCVGVLDKLQQRSSVCVCMLLLKNNKLSIASCVAGTLIESTSCSLLSD